MYDSKLIRTNNILHKAEDKNSNNKPRNSRSAIGRISPKAWVISLILHIVIAACFVRVSIQNAGAGQGEHETEAMIFDSAQLSDGLDSQQQLEELQQNIQNAQLSPSLTPQVPNQLDGSTDIKGDTIPDQTAELISRELAQQTISTETPTSENLETISDKSWQEYISQNTAISNAAGKGAASFFGIQSKGRKFVYIVDCSGSMKGDPLQAAKTEVFRSLKSLKKNMSFTIIFYNNTAITNGRASLTKATRPNIRKYNNWIEAISASGGTNPDSALKIALPLKPDCIWLLSDGRFGDNTLKLIKKLNPKAKTKINTIAFLDDSGSELLEKIAKQNRGRFRFVSRPRSLKNNRR